MKKNFIVYSHKNKINGKQYIGQTSDLARRWSQNGNRYKTCSRFYSAIIHYGWDNFEHIILEENLSQEEADKKEKFYIELYQTTNPEKGYNLTEGGTGLNGYYDNEENRKKHSQLLKKYYQDHSDKKENLSERISEIARLTAGQRSETMKKNYQNGGGFYTLNQNRKKKILCVETNEIFDSICEAAKYYDLSVGNLSSVLHGKRHTTGGYHWEFCEAQG